MTDLTTAASSQQQVTCLKQTTIVETFKKCKQFGANHSNQIKINHELMEWLIDAKLPYSTIENECFKNLCAPCAQDIKFFPKNISAPV